MQSGGGLVGGGYVINGAYEVQFLLVLHNLYVITFSSPEAIVGAISPVVYAPLPQAGLNVVMLHLSVPPGFEQI